jgi:hypothetical protein
MSYEITFIEKNGVVAIYNKGEIDYDELAKQSQEAIKLGREKNSRLFLTDFSNVEVNANMLEIFKFPGMYEQSGMSKLSKIAVVVSKKELKTEKMSFYDDICVNRGWQIKIFLQKDLALEWLASKE